MKAIIFLSLLTINTLGLTSCKEEKSEHSEGQVNSVVTWNGEIKKIFDDSCTGCHAENKIAFRLDTIDDAVRHQTAVMSAISARRMPIWLAEPGHMAYQNDPTLSDENITKIKSWYEIGSPEGSIPQTPLFPDTPVHLTDFNADIEVSPLPQGETYTPEASRPDDYRCFMAEWPSEDPLRYVTGFHVIPGNERIVHHLVAYKVSREVVPLLKKLDAEESSPGYKCFGGSFPDRLGDEGVRQRMEREFPGLIAKLQKSDMWLFHWAPGMSETRLPEGIGIPVKGDDVILLQVHYYTGGIANENDSGTTVLFQTDKQVEKPAFIFTLTDDPWFGGRYNKSMVIPPGEERIFTARETMSEIVAYGRSQLDIQNEVKAVEIHSANLHMHSYGATTETGLTNTNGERRVLLGIKNWDLHWQRDYIFRDKIVIPAAEMASTVQDISCHYVNPSKKTIYGGLGSDDEMCISMSIYALDLGSKQ